ncbi:neither inactivation nor afterpotential B [Arctopsyche grandis]|uniref:neither inactivation nor afterpotential B n=1 Tax=Arctopsyche grandis TaxID=121162 RepID=UPI00406D7F41
MNNNEVDTKGYLYPNCDSSVWLRSCEEEIIQPMQGVQKGEIPPWLNGTLLRNGPGSLKVGDMEFKHLFDSSALLHRFEIANGFATYQCRFLQSKSYKKNHAAQRIVVTEFGTESVPDPCHSIFDRFSAIFKPGEGYSDNAMISVYPFGDEIYTFTESPIIHKIDPITLETQKRLNVSEHVSIVNHTSHPHVMKNGDVYNLGLAITKKGPMYNIIRFPRNENNGNMFESAHRVASVPVRWPLHPGYMHTFGITENYYIVVEQPLSVSVYKLLKTQLSNKPMMGCFKWYKNQDTIFHIVKRSNGKVLQTFHSEAFFYLHIINQYEKDKHIVVDICCYKDPAMLECMYVDSMKTMQNNPEYASMFRGRPMRFVLPLQGEKVTLEASEAKAYTLPGGKIMVTPELLATIGCETPRINYDKYLGRPYQYFYAISSDVDAENPGTLIKVDAVNKNKMTWSEKNCYPSEPIFIPRPNAVDEDDGVVVAALVWGQNRSHEVGLLVLDAKSLKEVARTTFVTPSPVPKCLHGWFLPST